MLAHKVTRQPHTLKQLVLVASLFGVTGCYKYVPATIDAVPEGARVRAMITGAAQDDLRARTGIDQDVLEGEVIEQSDDMVLISVPTVDVSGAYGAQKLYQRVDVPRESIVRVDMRKLDTPVTVGLIGVAAGAATFFIIKAFEGGEPGSPGENGNVPPERRQPFWIAPPSVRR